MHGITLTSAPSDWEVLQQKDKKASVTLKGTFQVHPGSHTGRRGSGRTGR